MGNEGDKGGGEGGRFSIFSLLMMQDVQVECMILSGPETGLANIFSFIREGPT